MNISISNLTSATGYYVEVSAIIVRPDTVTGGNILLQSCPTALHVETGRKVSISLNSFLNKLPGIFNLVTHKVLQSYLHYVKMICAFDKPPNSHVL